MQLHQEHDIQNGSSAAEASLRRRRSPAKRKVTLRLTEPLCQRLEVATEGPGVRKSTVVEAAIERFLAPAPSVEDLVRERFDDLHGRFDRLEHDMRMVAETIAIHARYHLAVMPPVPQSREREAILLGEERFKVLAEQVERRVRLRLPLMQETIEHLTSTDRVEARSAAGEAKPGYQEKSQNQLSASGDIGEAHTTAPAGKGRNSTSSGRPTIAQQQQFADASGSSLESSPSNWKLIFCVFLPFATGYFLSYLVRTINAAISPALVSDFGLSASETGLLASVYFLVFAAAQLPIGVLLDRYGPRRVQSVLLIIAIGGATLFGNANGFAELLIGRVMMGLGVSAALMAGLKAIVTWFPKERVALVNGCMIMLGSLGAVTATTPTDWLLNWIGWRSLFEILTIVMSVTAAFIYLVAPEDDPKGKRPATEKQPTLRSVFFDPRFLRIAPLSATCIGSSWALQSLWAASWLTDVEGFGRQSLISQLFSMAVGISLGALLLGMMADRLRKRDVATEGLFGLVGGLFILAQLALILRLPMPSIVPWSVVSVVGAGTVLSYAMVADYFPKEMAARANGALNLLHFGCAFIVQYGMGLIVGQWAPQHGHYPITAYRAAFTTSLAFQVIALVWFVAPWLRSFAQRVSRSLAERHTAIHGAAVLVEGSLLEPHEQAEW
jgi:MFS family permease